MLRPVGRAEAEAGAGSVLVLAVVMAVLLLAAGTASAAQAISARHRAATAADLGALAALASPPTVSCERAARVVAAHGAVLQACLAGADGSVLVRVAVVPAGAAAVLGPATSTARAGRMAGVVEVSPVPSPRYTA